MTAYFYKNCRAIRIPQEDEREQILKTKIVATLGGLEKYKGLLASASPSSGGYAEVIRQFYEHGVDVIRVNLSHVDPGKVAARLKEIKDAVRACELANSNRKRMAVLADLPGPKIRFKPLEKKVFRLGEKFVVHFRSKVKGEARATVYLNNDPLELGLAKSVERLRVHNPAGVVNRNKMARDTFRQLIENTLGVGFVSAHTAGTPLSAIITAIKKKLSNREDVVIAVGDGEVMMRVDQRGIDPSGTSLKCRVVSIRSEYDGKGSPPPFPMIKNKGFTIRDVHFDTPSFTAEDEGKLDELLEAEYGVRFKTTTPKGEVLERPVEEVRAEYEQGGGEPDPVIAFVALSFAQTADDVLRAKQHVERRLKSLGMTEEEARLRAPSIIAKIETQKGWDNREYILDVADGIMVARGDLGLQVDIQKVPAIQKGLIRLCNKRGKPVITATQMLSSMARSVEPTRAEGTDVFNAILDGSDAVMMSEETADGKYPIAAIEKMVSIAAEAESYFERQDMTRELRHAINRLRFQEFLKDEAERVNQDIARFDNIGSVLSARAGVIDKGSDEAKRIAWRQELYTEKLGKAELQSTTDSITQATCLMSEGDSVEGIIAATTSGRTVRMISRLRPTVLLVGAAHDQVNTRKLAVSYGVLPLCVGRVESSEGTDGIFKRCEAEILKDEHLSVQLGRGRTVTFTAGTRLGKPGSTNLIQMREIGED